MATTTPTDPSTPRAPTRAPLVELDLEAQSEGLHRAAASAEAGHAAKTLLKEPDLRVVLIALRAGARIHEHKTNNRITVQTLTGHVRMRLPDREVDLPAQRMLFLEKGIPHDVVAHEDSTLLLTICWARASAD